jgi:hypothetical protein
MLQFLPYAMAAYGGYRGYKDSKDQGISGINRLLNTAAEGTEYLVTLEQSDGTDIGTFSIEGLSECIIQKDPTDQLFAANAAVLAVGVAINSN